MNALRGLLLCLLSLTLPSEARALEPSCATPQKAARSLLDWLQPDNYAPQSAAKCLDLSEQKSTDGARLAVQLKQVNTPEFKAYSVQVRKNAAALGRP